MAHNKRRAALPLVTGLLLALAGPAGGAEMRSAHLHWSYAPVEDGSAHALSYHSRSAWGGWRPAYGAHAHRIDHGGASDTVAALGLGVATDFWKTAPDDDLRLLVGPRLERSGDSRSFDLQVGARYTVRLAYYGVLNSLVGFVEATTVPHHRRRTGTEFRAGVRTRAVGNLGGAISAAHDPHDLHGGDRVEIGLFWMY